MEIVKIVINGVRYSLSCDIALPKKMANNNFPALEISLIIRNLEENRELKWDEFKNTYLAEKVSDYVRNTINGQRSFYWTYKEVD